jgi:small multidrug resistance pump
VTYLYLFVAIIAEVTATSALKASEEFTKLYPSLIVVVGYGVAFYFMTLVLRVIPIGITYAVWSGLGIVLVTIVGVFLYKQIARYSGNYRNGVNCFRSGSNKCVLKIY